MIQYEEKAEKILVGGNYIEKEDYDKAKKEALSLDVFILDHLVSGGYLTKDLLGQAIAEDYGVAYSDLNTNVPSKEQVLKIDKTFALKNRTILYDEGKKDVTIATDSPDAPGLKTSLKQIFPNKKIHISFSLPEDINTIVVFYEKSLEERIGDIIKSSINVAPQILNEIFKEAFVYKTSDIHLEPRSKNIHIRFRIDGVMQDKAVISKEIYESILNRVKVMAHLRIDQHKTTQDGSIRYEMENISFDLRISIAPTLYGEKVVARVLTSYLKGLSLENLGLEEYDQSVLREATKQPFGMIINVGPTGSGKTTTLYSMIQILNKPGVNITTIEDPVEYRLEGLNQIQVDESKQITFAKGLRSIVRQDPDIILVGEIRDRETAEIAVNASLTGHLLLSTFHANDAATAIPRLLDMGIEPFLLASTLELIVAQRLVRRICDNCRYSYSISKSEIEKQTKGYKVNIKGKTNLYKGKGCSVCNHTGYDGRVAIFEHVSATPELKELILENPSSDEIWEVASKQGSKSLFDDGFEKVRKGVTSIEELMRVAKPPKKNGKKTKK